MSEKGSVYVPDVPQATQNQATLNRLVFFFSLLVAGFLIYSFQHPENQFQGTGSAEFSGGKWFSRSYHGRLNYVSEYEFTLDGVKNANGSWTISGQGLKRDEYDVVDVHGACRGQGFVGKGKYIEELYIVITDKRTSAKVGLKADVRGRSLSNVVLQDAELLEKQFGQ